MKKALRRNPGSSKEAQKQQKILRQYRMGQAAIAIYRDNATCVNCYQFLGRVKDYDHVHHTEGRGTFEKEHYTKLVCLCIECHEKFSVMKQGNKPIHKKQRELIRIANEHPINFCFVVEES